MKFRICTINDNNNNNGSCVSNRGSERNRWTSIDVELSNQTFKPKYETILSLSRNFTSDKKYNVNDPKIRKKNVIP